MSHDPNEPLPGNDEQSDANRAPVTVPPEQTAKYWQDKYNGLNSYVQGKDGKGGLKAKHDQLVSELSTAREQAAAAEVEWQSKYNTAAQTASQHEKTAQSLTQERDSLKAQRDVGRVIRKDFPTLAPLFEDGLLLGVESMDEAGRTEYLTRYAERLGVTHETQVKGSVEGSTPKTPTPPRADGVTDVKSARAALDQAASKHGYNSTEYMAAMNEYMSAVNNGD